jgi:hypothetical protein
MAMTSPTSSLYVDDMVLTGSSPALLHHIVQRLRAEFSIKDLGELRFFLGIAVKRDAHGFYLSQQQYAEDILERAGMSSYKSATTPIDAKGKLSADGDKIDDAATYRSLGQCIAVPDHHKTGSCIRRSAAVLVYARSKSATFCSTQASSLVCARHDKA